MKLHYFLSLLLLITGCTTLAQTKQQDSLIKYYSKFPEIAIQKADSLYRIGIKKKDNVLILKSLILRTSFTLRKDYDQYPQQIQYLEKIISEEKDIAMRSLLHSYVGELYHDFYLRNAWTINQYTPLADEIPTNMNLWSKNLFDSKINEHLRMSINPKEILKKTSVNIYDKLLIKGAASDSLQPTLYDFLCHRFFQLTPQSAQEYDYCQKCPPELYGDVHTFIAFPLPDSCDHTLQVWQQLLAFRLQEKNKVPAALIWADLERIRKINSLYHLSKCKDLYAQTLKRMIHEYTNHPLVIEIIADYAIHLYYQSYSKSPNEQDKIRKEILDICEDGIRRYSSYSRIGRLKSIINKLKNCSANIHFPKEVYPGEEFKIRLNYINLQQLQLEIIKLPDNTMLHYDTWQYTDNTDTGSPHQLLTLNLKEKLVYQDTIICMKGLPAGIYAIRIYGKKFKKEPYKTLVSTSLTGIQQNDENTTRLQILDVNSGFPVANANILFYHFNHLHFQQIGKMTTNQEGFVNYKKENNQKIYYRIINQKNPDSYAFSLETSYHYPQVSNKSNTQLITDRSIYRPGETIYFKGYSWTSTTNHLKANQNKKHQIIFKDANKKEISKINTTSNQFGSFTGSFMIPNNAMSGTYYLQDQENYHHIQVVEYRRPEFEVILETPEQFFHDGDTIRIKGKAISYSGVNIANTLIQYTVESIGYSKRYERYTIPGGKVFTNSLGEFEIQFIAHKTKSDKITPMMHRFYHVIASLTDSKGETQESSINIPVYHDKAKPILEIPWRIDKTSPAVFSINLSNYPTDKAQEVYYSLERLVKQTDLTQKIDTTIEKKIAEGKQTILKRDSVILQLTNESSGAYLFTAECNNMKEQQVFYLYSPKDKCPPMATYSWLIEEKTVCQDKEKARILFGSSLENIYVQYEVFSNNKSVLSQHAVLNNEITAIEIPYLKEYANEIYLYIHYLKNKHYTSHSIKLRRQQNLPQIKIKTTVLRDRLTPGKQEEWQLDITNHGQITFAEVLAMMYDASLDKFAPHNFKFNPQLLNLYASPHFYPQQRLYNKQSMHLIGTKAVYSSTNIPAFSFNTLNLYSPPRVNNLLHTTRTKMQTNNAPIDISTDFETYGMKAEAEIITDEATASVPKGAIQLRENLQSTAFFYPQLQTDSTGKVNIRFTVPDALTRWKFIALATTQDMGSDQIEHYITTCKPLMIRPNLPRFLRCEDQTEIKAIISNLSDSLQQGTATLELLHPGTNEIILRREDSFKINARQNSPVSFTFKVPNQHDLVICRIIAKGSDFNDGEQQYLPILSNKISVNTTLPIFVNTAGKHTFVLKEKNMNSQNYRLTLEMTANPTWYAIQALPTLQQPAHENAIDLAAAYYVNAIASYIVNANPVIADAISQWKKRDTQELISPLLKNPELKSILAETTPWALEAQNETERMQSLSELFDKNRLDYLQKQTLQKLIELQTKEGGWSWFKNMPSNTFITLNILNIIQRVALHAQQPLSEQEKTIQFKAIRYLDKEIIKAYEKKVKHITYEQVVYLYVRYLYCDIPFGEALTAHKHFMQLALKQWGQASFYEKALLAMTFQHYGFKEEAQKVIESLRQYAVVTPENGMYWPNNRNIASHNSTIQTHTAILEAFNEINGYSQEIKQMQQWLLRQKEAQNWGSVPSTIDAIHAILLGDNNILATKETVNIKVGSHHLSTADANNMAGYLKVSYPANKITPKMQKIEIDKQTSIPSWGGIYLQSFQKLADIKMQETILKVDKKLYSETINEKGKKELIPIDGRSLKTGEKIIIRLSLSIKQDMEYLHLKDLRAACLEPTEQLSGYEYQNGIFYYKEVKDANTNFFFDFLPRGYYVIEYSAWVNQSGIYQDGIANLQCIYTPIYNAYSNTNKIIVTE